MLGSVDQQRDGGGEDQTHQSTCRRAAWLCQPGAVGQKGGHVGSVSGGRPSVNLIAGQSEAETTAEGITLPKEDRYALMDEDVSIMKALWTARAPINFEGRFHTLKGARISPQPLQRPYPRFYLGGGSAEAWELSAKHADVHLFWGDTPE